MLFSPSITSPRSPEATSRFLELRALAGMEHLRFTARGRVDGSYSGRHASRRQGGAAEFVDYREYTPGQDLRRLDWKVLARTGKPYVRVYQDETNLRCVPLIDASASMTFAGFGSEKGELARSKLEYAQYFVTALSHLVTAQQDQVGLAVAADGLVDFLAPAGTSTHVRRLQSTVENLKAQPQTKLAEALDDLFARLSGRGVLMVMSDFLVDDLDAVIAGLRLFKHSRWETIVLHLIHPAEQRLPEGTAYRFEGMEGDGRIDATPAQVHREYERRFAAHGEAVRRGVLAAGCDYRRVTTSVPYLQTLGDFLVERNG